MRFGPCLTKFLLALAAFPLAPSAGPAAPQGQISAEARTAWGFEGSDLPPHPGVKFGVLPNGMRYAIMRNRVPSGGLSVRLRLDAGAKVEGRGEQGHMHLLEHLLFHGTANIPEGSLPLMLAHRGLRHWSDVNAYTSFDETVYRVDMARSDAAAREAALLVMREVASNLSFANAAVAGARRNVREEIAARNGTEDSIVSAQNAFFLPGTAMDRGPVAGTWSQVAGANSRALRRLYDLHYRPERATLVVVGDFDPGPVEAEISDRFSGWSARGPAPAEPPQPAIASGRGGEARLFVNRNAPTTVTVAAVAPLAGVDAGRRRDAHFLEFLAAQMLNHRLAQLAARPDASIASADLAIYDHYATARIARIEIAARDRDWQGAVRAGASALRDALEQGFSQAELDRQTAAGRVSGIRDAAPRTSGALADVIVDAVNRRIVFTEPADRSGTAAYLARVRLSDVNAAFRAVWVDKGPLIFVSHNRRIGSPEARILAAWRGLEPAAGHVRMRSQGTRRAARHETN